MKKKRIGLIGHLAFGQEKYDGQTVSTRMWKNELCKMVAVESPVMVDTYDYKHRIFPILSNLLKCMLSCSHIVFMLSGNGMSVFLPLLFYSNKLFHRKIYHRVIGGSICDYVNKNTKWIKYLNSFEVNWVQSNRIVEELKELGVNNGEYLENFRDIDSIKLEEIEKDYSRPYQFCTFCRVSKQKGISTAIEAIKKVNIKNGKGTAELHIYGPIDDNYKEEFDLLISDNHDCVFYEGAIPSNEAVRTLKNYYFHLFPTTWTGEGFPGTLIDCYNAGLPTIATDWAYNSEYIIHGKTGYLYEWNKPELLEDIIICAIDDSQEVHYNMRIANLSEAEKYRSDRVIKKIIDRMNY